MKQRSGAARFLFASKPDGFLAAMRPMGEPVALGWLTALSANHWSSCSSGWHSWSPHLACFDLSYNPVHVEPRLQFTVSAAHSINRNVYIISFLSFHHQLYVAWERHTRGVKVLTKLRASQCVWGGAVKNCELVEQEQRLVLSDWFDEDLSPGGAHTHETKRQNREREATEEQNVSGISIWIHFKH